MPSDTFKFNPQGQLPYPGSCVLCASDLRGCIDFGVTLDHHGALLICTQCILEITNVDELGLVKRKDVEETLIENKVLNDRDEVLNTELGVMRNGVVAILNHFSDVLRNTRSVVVDDGTDSETDGLDFYGDDPS